ncbi:Dihydroorotate dehydrogenase (quinone), mitochondrial [Curvularia clavata]|uniref:Dihydroorotate dehydrogenase (quinone), mitochondrial n=1 Tax=Curvularia clavata TaxID=95742 RepID=A0A9Q9DNJ4_CURCL|nr:Dihydroorotate dehydrogenase (quinone), mitochondrial [Curvularia clavata]
MRALRVRAAIPRCRPSHRPFQSPSRFATTTTTTAGAATNVSSAGTRAKNLIYGSLLALGGTFGYLYVTDTRASIHEWLVVPALRLIYPDGEEAHHAGTQMLKALYSFGLNPRERGVADSQGDLAVEVFGHTLNNPIGTSAGIDKGAEVPTPLFDMGAGVVEVGAITLMPQEGNPKPRVFRIPSQNALINRYGFNSEGAELVASRLRQRVREFAYHAGLGLDEEAERRVLDGEAGVPPGSLHKGRLMAVQVAKNKTTSENDIEAVVRDYATAVGYVGKYADILVVNVSSPNTPGLRTLQNVEPLTRLLSGVVSAVKNIDRKTKPAIMVKVSPDEDSEEQISGICEAVWDSGVDGVIVGNTTKKRPDPLPKGYLLTQSEANVLLEQGGYSGPQMFERTLALVKKYRKALDEGPKQITLPTQSEDMKPSAVQSSGDGSPANAAEKLEPEPSTKPLKTKPTLDLEQPAPKPASSDFDDLSESAPVVTVQSMPKVAPAPDAPRKVIFATGGITNGRQAREILDAGASVAQMYTAIVYGGAGTITRVKQEMRDDAKAQKNLTKS